MTPKSRQTIYLLGTIIPSILGLAVLWGGFDQGAAQNVGQIIAGLVALLGAGAPAVAASTIAKQKKDGTFDTVAPADQVINGVQAVIEAQAHATAELERAKQAVVEVAGVVPVFGPLAQQVIRSLPSVPTVGDFSPAFNYFPQGRA